VPLPIAEGGAIIPIAAIAAWLVFTPDPPRLQQF